MAARSLGGEVLGPRISLGQLSPAVFFRATHEVNFSVHSHSLAGKIFFHKQTGETTSKFFPNVWETLLILTRKHLLVDIFVTRILPKSLAFCEFASIKFRALY